MYSLLDKNFYLCLLPMVACFWLFCERKRVFVRTQEYVFYIFAVAKAFTSCGCGEPS